MAEQEVRLKPKFRPHEVALIFAVIIGVVGWLGWRWYRSTTPEAHTKAACRMSIREGDYTFSLMDHEKADPTVRQRIKEAGEAARALDYYDRTRRSDEAQGNPYGESLSDFAAASLRFDGTLRALRDSCKPYEPGW